MTENNVLYYIYKENKPIFAGTDCKSALSCGNKSERSDYNNSESNQHPCLSLIQFQIDNGKLILSAYQLSSDANLGLPSDIYHLYLISRKINLQLKSITLFLGNVHIYENNLKLTKHLLKGGDVKFNLNVGL